MAQFNIYLPVGGTEGLTSLDDAIKTWVQRVDVETDPLWQPQMTAGYEFSFYFFGPPYWYRTIKKYNPSANFSKTPYPLVAFTVPEGIQFGENRPVQTIDAIGTTRRLSKSKYMGGGWGASRIIFKGSNLEYWAYRFLLDDTNGLAIRKGYDPLDPSTWSNGGDTDTIVRYSGGDGNYRINSLVSTVFNYPFGILELFVTPDGDLIEGKYYENCNIQSHAHSVAPGGPVIMRNVSGSFQSTVPVDQTDIATSIPTITTQTNLKPSK